MYVCIFLCMTDLKFLHHATTNFFFRDITIINNLSIHVYFLLLFSMFFFIRVPRKSIITIYFIFFRTLIVERGRGKVNKEKEERRN